MENSDASSNGNIGQAHPENATESIVTVGQRLDRMCDAAQIAWKGGRDAAREFRGALDINGRVDRNPYAMMAAAVGSGYVLGGGIFSPLTARIVGVGLRVGLRMAAVPFIQRELLGFAEAAGEAGNGAKSTSHKAPKSKVVNKEEMV